ncbi:MAG: response regulator [Treponema sp.]|jgi:PAS domain S-box-containing protein|nr:response regulator [Treponema sp.]
MDWGKKIFQNRRRKEQAQADKFEELELRLLEVAKLNMALLETTPVGIIFHNDKQQLIDCNDKACEIFHATKEKILNDFASFSPEYQPNGEKSSEKIAEIMLNAISGKYQILDWTHISSSGRLIPCEITVTGVMLGDKYFGIASIYDLSNLKEAEKAAARAEALTNVITEANPLAYILFNEEMNVLDCNSMTLKLFECPDKQTLMTNYWKQFVPEYQKNGYTSIEFSRMMRDKVLLKNNTVYEMLHQTANGELIPVENTLSLLSFENNNYFISFKYDLRNTRKLTENIHAQSELLKIRLEQQEMLADIAKGLIGKEDIRKMIETALEKLGLYLRADRIVIISFNREKKSTNNEYIWYSKKAPLLAENTTFPHQLITGSFPEELSSISISPVINRSLAAGSGDDFRLLADINVGGFIWSSLYVEGRLWGVLSVEQCGERREWTDNEQIFVSMTASTISGAIVREIYNKRLNEALMQATVASKAKGEFLSNMSHEMRTPLNAIIGMTIIGRNAQNINQKDYALDKVKNASNHLLGVINDVLDMSKIEANKLELSSIEYNFEQMLQRVITMINFRMYEKNHKFLIDIDSNIPCFITGDDQRIAQVITNLLSNAVKFTPNGGEIRLDALMTEIYGNECELRIEVKDNGIGISPEQQKDLFTAFGQADSGTSRVFGGTGLGLALSRRIVELMDGRIWIESKLGSGAKFIFTIKVHSSEKTLASLLNPDINHASTNILVISGEEKVRDLFIRTLNSLNINCDATADASEASDMIQKNYNLYFIDSYVYGINGFEFAEKIREKNKNAFVIMLVSVSEWSDMKETAIDGGIDKHLIKPLFAPMIIDCINENLNCLHEEGSSGDSSGEFNGKHLLLAEDIEINREIVISLFEGTGMFIDCANNGQEALEMFKLSPEKYDLIFMDLQMPKMDGLEAARHIRAFEAKRGEQAKRVPIIAMTANVFKEDIDNCIAAGMDDHIGKPINFDEIFEKTRNVFLSQ